MFDIGFSELLLIAIVALLVMGPERLPQAMRTLALWLGRARLMFSKLRLELENEVGINEVRRQLHNEEILQDLKHSALELEKLSIQGTATSTEKAQGTPQPTESPEQGKK